MMSEERPTELGSRARSRTPPVDAVGAGRDATGHRRGPPVGGRPRKHPGVPL